MTKRKGRIKGSKNGVYSIKRSLEEAEKLFLDNMKLVPFTLHHMGIEITDDGMQDGYLGLWIASLCFDDSLGKMFSSYAVPSIRGMVIRSRQGTKRSVQPELSLNQSAYKPDDEEPRRQLEEIVEDPDAFKEADDLETNMTLRTFLNDTEVTVLRMWLDGYQRKEIDSYFGKNRMWSDNQLTKIKKKLKAEYAERENNGKT